MILFLVMFFASGCSSMPARSPEATAIALSFANVAKDSLDVLQADVKANFKRDAFLAASECKPDNDPCQELKIHDVRLRYETVIAHLNAASALQSTLAGLTNAQLDCINQSDDECARTKERAILDQIPNLVSLIDAVSKSMPKGGP